MTETPSGPDIARLPRDSLIVHHRHADALTLSWHGGSRSGEAAFNPIRAVVLLFLIGLGNIPLTAILGGLLLPSVTPLIILLYNATFLALLHRFFRPDPALGDEKLVLLPDRIRWYNAAEFGATVRGTLLPSWYCFPAAARGEIPGRHDLPREAIRRIAWLPTAGELRISLETTDGTGLGGPWAIGNTLAAWDRAWLYQRLHAWHTRDFPTFLAEARAVCRSEGELPGTGDDPAAPPGPYDPASEAITRRPPLPLPVKGLFTVLTLWLTINLATEWRLWDRAARDLSHHSLCTWSRYRYLGVFPPLFFRFAGEEAYCEAIWKHRHRNVIGCYLGTFDWGGPVGPGRRYHEILRLSQDLEFDDALLDRDLPAMFRVADSSRRVDLRGNYRRERQRLQQEAWTRLSAAAPNGAAWGNVEILQELVLKTLEGPNAPLPTFVRLAWPVSTEGRRHPAAPDPAPDPYPPLVLHLDMAWRARFGARLFELIPVKEATVAPPLFLVGITLTLPAEAATPERAGMAEAVLDVHLHLRPGAERPATPPPLSGDPGIACPFAGCRRAIATGVAVPFPLVPDALGHLAGTVVDTFGRRHCSR